MVNSPGPLNRESVTAPPPLEETGSELNGELTVVGGTLLIGLIGEEVVVGRWVVVVVVVVVLVVVVGGVVVVGLLEYVTGTLVVRVGYPLVGGGS